MFKQNSKAIYLQIADRLCDDILTQNLLPEERIPSVRECAMTMQVNPNTVMRTYEWLAAKNIIYNRRGIGYFISPDASERVMEIRREDFLGNEIFSMFRQLRLLGVKPETLQEKYEEYLKKTTTEE